MSEVGANERKTGLWRHIMKKWCVDSASDQETENFTEMDNNYFIPTDLTETELTAISALMAEIRFNN